jgi:hypothetical protein
MSQKLNTISTVKIFSILKHYFIVRCFHLTLVIVLLYYYVIVTSHHFINRVKYNHFAFETYSHITI